MKQLIGNKLWLAPLAGYTDQAFRKLCKDHGADVLVSEMVSADGLVRDSAKTIRYIIFDPVERPFGIQIFGSDPLIMAKAAEFCLAWKPDFIDINMGCPVKKVVRRGAGSALMKNLTLAGEIVKACKSALCGEIPLSVKFRSGWDFNNLNFLEFGMLMQDSGADFLCLHPRTQTQMFSGKSDWDHIALLKKNLSIPLIGNGDIISPKTALQLYSHTNCDSVMIGRGALGKPWIFEQIKELMRGETPSPITKDKLRQCIFDHISLALQIKRESVVVKEMRSQIGFYTKGIIGGAELRKRMNSTDSIDEIYELLDSALLI
ncbi:MAG: tRNA dihydrouridine synthase DusB [Candidatus Cloacimonadaceae bacterium]|nr:tRNA dihydrouridine synthase DusB [Candidatus Cloacimonadaceae bacterium]